MPILPSLELPYIDMGGEWGDFADYYNAQLNKEAAN